MLEWVKDHEHLRALRDKHKEYFVLVFWGAFSETAMRAREEIERFAEMHKDIPVLVVDVQQVKGAHKQFDVTRVPTVLAVKNGNVIHSIEGVERAEFYSLHFAGAAPSRTTGQGERRVRRVTVYSGPGCPACGQLKNYLRRRGVSFQEIDLSRDARAAEKVVRRSGMSAVPQTDINGRLVVGFDRPKLDRLLGIQPERKSNGDTPH